jgi:hypothetical protein
MAWRSVCEAYVVQTAAGMPVTCVHAALTSEDAGAARADALLALSLVGVDASCALDGAGAIASASAHGVLSLHARAAPSLLRELSLRVAARGGDGRCLHVDVAARAGPEPLAVTDAALAALGTELPAWLAAASAPGPTAAPPPPLPSPRAFECAVAAPPAPRDADAPFELRPTVVVSAALPLLVLDVVAAAAQGAPSRVLAREELQRQFSDNPAIFDDGSTRDFVASLVSPDTARSRRVRARFRAVGERVAAVTAIASTLQRAVGRRSSIKRPRPWFGPWFRHLSG